MENLAKKVNWILLGLLMLVSGLLKLFYTKIDGVGGMLSEIALFSWAPVFWAWILIISEILFGILILAKWKLNYSVIPPIIIMIVAALFVAWGQWPLVLMHLTIAANYWVLGSTNQK